MQAKRRRVGSSRVSRRMVAGIVVASGMPGLVLAQASPFMTGMTSLQSKGRTLLGAATRVREALPDAEIRAFALMRTMGLVAEVGQLLEPCQGEIRWAGEDAHREP